MEIKQALAVARSCARSFLPEGDLPTSVHTIADEVDRLQALLIELQQKNRDLESAMHEVAAMIPIDDWGPDVDTSKICAEVRRIVNKLADSEAELDLLRSAGKFIASRNDGLSLVQGGKPAASEIARDEAE